MGRAKVWKALATPVEPVRFPSRQAVNIDHVEYVARTGGGDLIVVAKRGAREITINIPRSAVPDLIARLRRPI